ncbi:hypothetical protein LSUE1_G000540 [Lachnellula suecica]|uniref:Uncharacterized protein n=1 Tax=Lachnellula suecica TaxID=602035 RepID=A0A8T9CI89_9HELO|nr:hypothetical protein LSUE1_G000540 [Lachnellula suecica]
MADPARSGASGGAAPPPRRNGLPPEIMEIVWPAIQYGALAGTTGLVVGGFVGLARPRPPMAPMATAFVSSLRGFSFASTFWASRGFTLKAWGKDRVTPRDEISASAIAGGLGGIADGLLKGRTFLVRAGRVNTFPAVVMFSLLGAAGQAAHNRNTTRNADLSQTTPAKSEPFSWMNSKWSPMKVLSDVEYEKMLQEKLLRVNAEIAMIDDNIAALRAQEQGIAAKTVAADSNESCST